MHSYCPDTSEPQHGCQCSSKMPYPHIWKLGLVDCFEAGENVQQGLPGQCLFLSYQVFTMIASV